MAETTNTGPQKTFHLANNILALLLVVVAIAAFAGGWYVGNHHHQRTATDQSVSGFIKYTNPQYGFQLLYPADWLRPTLTTADQSGTKNYNIQFYKSDPAGKLQYYIILNMANDNGKSTSSTTVKQTLKSNKSALTVSDTTSFAQVASLPQQKNSILAAIQIVDLKKINVTAASITYQINGGTVNCPQNKFATNSGGGCIERSDYDTVNTVLKSIKSL